MATELQTLLAPLASLDAGPMSEYRKGYVAALRLVLTLPQTRIDSIQKMRDTTRPVAEDIDEGQVNDAS